MTIATDNDAAIFWQSRLTTPGRIALFPHLTDLRALARQVRMGDGRGRPPASPVPAPTAAESSRAEKSQ